MQKFRPLSAIHNRRVVDTGGEFVGRIHDVLLDLRDGKIEYICIALSDGESVDESEVVVPWSAMRRGDSGDSQWQIAARRSVLRNIAQPASRRK